MKNTKTALVILVVAIAMLAIVFLCVDEVPPVAFTDTTMTVTKQRIREYVVIHHRLPSSLSDLPPLENNRDSSFIDGWGRPIQYTKEGQTVTLLSLGKDGRPGGTDQDADIKVSFTIEPASSQSTG